MSVDKNQTWGIYCHTFSISVAAFYQDTPEQLHSMHIEIKLMTLFRANLGIPCLKEQWESATDCEFLTLYIS